ncbi:MAG: flavodoxin [Sutterella sp.]|nr:flavodoxin [Sutterella sp.]
MIFLSVTGHTASLAEAAARAAGADLFRLVPQPPYPDAWLDAAREVGREQKTGIVRAVRCPPFDPADYDALIVLTPTWNGRAAGLLAAWLKARNLPGRFAVTGITHGGGGVMKTRSDLRAALPGVRLGTHRAVFDSVDPRMNG